jgi:hypothetical protein
MTFVCHNNLQEIKTCRALRVLLVRTLAYNRLVKVKVKVKVKLKVKIKVKQSPYRPGQALSVPGG